MSETKQTSLKSFYSNKEKEEEEEKPQNKAAFRSVKVRFYRCRRVSGGEPSAGRTFQ